MQNPQNYLASRWKRFTGAMCDGLISILLVLPVMWAMGVLEQTAAGDSLSLGETAFFFVLSWLIFMVLHGYLLAKHGQTIGKRLVGTRIVGLDGSILPLNRVFLYRYLLIGIIGQIPFAGGIVSLADVLMIFGRDRRCLHDKLAGTLVIDASIPVQTVDAEVIEESP